jgi:hypothetical protein
MNSSRTDVASFYVVDRPLNRYHRLLTATAQVLERDRMAAAGAWSPKFDVPDSSDPRWSEFFQSTPLRFGPIGSYRGHIFDTIDLTGNPGTMTTKSLASNTMIARVVLHVQRSGRPLTIVTPTSGNKGTALRDALARAQNIGIPGADFVRLVMLVPVASASKLRHCINDSDPDFSTRNPIVLVNVETSAELKDVAAQAVEEVGASAVGQRIDHWYSLSLDNYRFADAMRAFLEHDATVARGIVANRLHVQSVSSAYGLLGYELGREVLDLDEESRLTPLPLANYFLVQHLSTPDMVLHLRQGDREGAPEYVPAPNGDGFIQNSDLRFPFITDDPHEILDPTFYTRNPPTAPTMTELIRRHGGGGIVVSKRECLSRFTEIAELFGHALHFPEDPHSLREWSLMMAACGILNAIDRGMVHTDRIVVHATGSYWDEVLAPYPADRVVELSSVDQLVALLGH